MLPMPVPLIRVDVEELGGRTVVVLTGDLDVATAPDVRQRFTDLVVHGSREVIVDLDGVTRVDDIGLGVLVGGAWRARSSGGSFAVVCSGGPVREALALTRLDRAFDVHATLAGARAASG